MQIIADLLGYFSQTLADHGASRGLSAQVEVEGGRSQRRLSRLAAASGSVLAVPRAPNENVGGAVGQETSYDFF